MVDNNIPIDALKKITCSGFIDSIRKDDVGDFSYYLFEVYGDKFFNMDTFYLASANGFITNNVTRIFKAVFVFKANKIFKLLVSLLGINGVRLLAPVCRDNLLFNAIRYDNFCAFTHIFSLKRDSLSLIEEIICQNEDFLYTEGGKKYVIFMLHFNMDLDEKKSLMRFL